MQTTLQGKRALVTGAGTGIGREVALEFARRGADVALHYSHSSEGARTAVEEIRSLGRRSEAIAADFTKAEEAIRLGEAAIEFLGGVDCLVNNAGITMNKPFRKVTVEQFDTLIHVNLRAQFFLTQRIVEDMLGRGQGAVCNITSIHAYQAMPEHTVYAATKGAIVAYTRTLAVELAHRGIRVNAIAPGWITVENYKKWSPEFDPEEAKERAKDTMPIGRYGVPLDVARLAAFLCSDDADFIVGQTITLDGGTTSLMSLVKDFKTELSSRSGTGYVPGV